MYGENLDGNYTRMLRAILNKSWRQHSTKQQLYGHLPPITKNIQVRRTRHAGHRWRIKDELISDILLWTPSHGHATAGRTARTYIQQFWADIGCSPENLPEAMDDRDGGERRFRDIHADGHDNDDDVDEKFSENQNHNCLVVIHIGLDIIYLPKSSATRRMWLKANFSVELNKSEVRVFPLLNLLLCQD